MWNVFGVSNNIYLDDLHIFWAYVFADIELNLKLPILAAILNLKYVSSLKVTKLFITNFIY